MVSRLLLPFTDNQPGVTFRDLHFGHSVMSLGSTFNDEDQRWEPAATDARIVTEGSGWLASAECWGWAMVDLQMKMLAPSSISPGACNK